MSANPFNTPSQRPAPETPDDGDDVQEGAVSPETPEGGAEAAANEAGVVDPNAPRPRYVRPKPDQPRKVRGGLKFAGKDAPLIKSWIGRRWMRSVEEGAPPERLAQGIEYGRLGQTKDVSIRPGVVEANVQGRAGKPYKVRLTMSSFSHEQWEMALKSMADQAIYAAKLLAGELPVNVEDMFAPLDLRLFPAEPGDLAPSCTCDDEAQWCKHACCVACLFAEKLEADPFLMFSLRGMPATELSERLRQRRAVAGSAMGAAPAYTPRPVQGAEQPAPALEESLDEFWTVGPELETVETALHKPAVSHALLKRLGPTPFAGARFPLVGLLATCYDTISEAARKGGAEEEG